MKPQRALARSRTGSKPFAMQEAVHRFKYAWIVLNKGTSEIASPSAME